MAIGDNYKLTLRMTFTGTDTIVNTFHYQQRLATVFDTPSEDLAQAWYNLAWPDYRDFLSTRIVLQVIEVRPVDPAGDFFDLTVGESGSHSSGDITPLYTAPIVTWRTGLIGRANRGRSYLPPPPEAVQDAGAITAPYKAIIQAWADGNSFLSDGGVLYANWQQVINNQESLGTFPFVTGNIVRDIFGVQRRRKQGVGS